MAEPAPLPVARQFDLVGHAKAVTALEADHNGSRLVAGGNDYMVHLWDFGGLKSDGKSFRSFEATEGHPVVAVSALLVCSAGCRCTAAMCLRKHCESPLAAPSKPSLRLF